MEKFQTCFWQGVTFTHSHSACSIQCHPLRIASLFRLFLLTPWLEFAFRLERLLCVVIQHRFWRYCFEISNVNFDTFVIVIYLWFFQRYWIGSVAKTITPKCKTQRPANLKHIENLSQSNQMQYQHYKFVVLRCALLVSLRIQIKTIFFICSKRIQIDSSWHATKQTPPRPHTLTMLGLHVCLEMLLFVNGDK